MTNEIIYFNNDFKYYISGLIVGCISTCLYLSFSYIVYILLSTLLTFIIYVLLKIYNNNKESKLN